MNELDKMARRINARIQKLYEETGSNTKAFKGYESYLDQAFKDHIDTSKGYPQIKRGKSLDTLKNAPFKFDQLNNMETYGDIKRKAVKQLKEQGVTKPEKSDISAQIELSESAEKIINDNAYKYDMYEDAELEYAKNTLKKKGERKTWEQIRKIVEILKKSYSKKKIKEPKNEFGMIEGVNR